MKTLKNQQGFTAFELVLVVVTLFAIGAAGYFAYQARQNATETTTAAKSAATPAPTATPASPKTDDELLTASLLAYCKSSTSNAGTTASFNSKENIGNYYRVNGGCMVPGSEGSAGFEAYFKKESGKMTFLLATQQTPGKEDGAKYGLPSAWYSTEY